MVSAARSAAGVEVRNWDGSVVSHPSVVVRPRTVDELVAIVKDRERYPSPVRPAGSNHSTALCTVADSGTLVDMTAMNQIIEIGPDTVTAQGGALHIDVARELEKHNLQFYVNVEIGNLTMGSACCGGTKDASMPGEFGQVSSYAIGMKLVTASGDLIEVTEDDPELLQVMRSSYGLLGIVYEVTFRVQPLRPMAVQYETYSIEEFGQRLPELWARNESMMMYIFPFTRQITVEYRKYHEHSGRPNRYKWKLRNFVWKTLGPVVGYGATHYISNERVRYSLLNGFNKMIQLMTTHGIGCQHTSATDQIIRYPDKAGNSKYVFSLWGFPEERYVDVLNDYIDFCHEYYDTYGYRCDLLNVGYRVLEDQSSLFSYSFDGNSMTVDPVSTGSEGWEDFLKAYNEFCSERGGTPLFNQTKWLEPHQIKKAFGNRLETFNGYRTQYDPDDRLLSSYFAELLT